CQERARDEAVEEASEKSSLVDLFKVVVKNPQLRIIVICMFLYYLANGVITGGIGLNYYYLSVGYGGSQGGFVVTLISVFYVAAMIGSQALYPVLAKKMPKKKILIIGTIICLVGALGFFLTCFPMFGDTPLSLSANTYVPTEGMDFGWALGGMMWCNYLFPFLFFFGAGTIYMVILVMFQDSIDYNEYRFGDRRESLISAWRPLTVKLGSALLRGIQFLVFLTAGVMSTVTAISTAEQNLSSKSITAEQFDQQIKAAMDTVAPENLRIIGLWIVIILVACFVTVFVIIMLNYKISEEKHLKIVEEIEKRHAEGESEPVEVTAENDIVLNS
nr:MFS transporter [Bacilli bacterium]